MKPLLIVVGVLALQALLFSAYSAVRAALRIRSVVPVVWPLGGAVVCERRAGAVDVQMESNRIGGYIQESHFAGCGFYWHENDTGGD